MMTLYEFALSGNSHKIRLMLSLLGLDYRSVIVNGSEWQQKSVDFIHESFWLGACINR